MLLLVFLLFGAPLGVQKGAEGLTPHVETPATLHGANSANSASDVPDEEGLRQAPQRRGQVGTRLGAGVYKTQITPHWFQSNRRFWYRNDLRGSAKEFVVVDVERGTREAAFDHVNLAAALSKASGAEYQAHRLPFDSIEFLDSASAIKFKVGDTAWKCDLATYECSKMERSPDGRESGAWDEAPGVRDVRGDEQQEEPVQLESPWPDEMSPDSEQSPQPQGGPGQGRGQREPVAPRSPDGEWTAYVKENNVYVRSGNGGSEIQLCQDGKEGLAYGMLQWAPDSKTLVAFRIDPGEQKEVYLIESSPKEGGRAKLRTRPYALPGDKLTSYELNLFDVANRKQTKPDVDPIDLGTPRLHWQPHGRSLTYQKTDRGHQRFRLIEVDSHTGKARNIIDEKTETFIWTAHTESVTLNRVNYLDKTEEILYASERDGYRHLYLIGAKEGKVKNQITKGEYVVRGIDRIDQENRQVWFRASGKNPDQDPYLIHYYRVNFDGTGLTALTESNGNHTIQYSPDRKYVIDTYSRVDLATVHELRRVADGKLVCELERADISELQASGWEPPEVFVAKGRDGQTDIWGIICRPPRFDPNKKYPVIEQIYAGPQGAFVPKSFSPARRFASLTGLGFIVVQIDGMGTAHRSKTFHDVCWHNLRDAGFPDRILWHQAAAKKYSYYDISRVGIYGTSAGGQNSTSAVLFHPEFYKAAVSACGCHDNRLDKASWNEQWMGYPVGSQYAESSNIDNAHKLQGKLLLIVGELDTNVPPESTLRLVDALVKAGKDFDLLVVPGMGHSNGGAYGVRRMQDFFVRHLHGIAPPERNALSRQGSAGTGNGSMLPAITTPPDSFFERVRDRDRDAARKFYRKYLDVKGVPVVASAEVADEALERTHFIVTHLLAGRPDILQAMVKNGTRLIIIGKDQVYTDMPEYRNSRNPEYQNERVRGTGGFDVTSFGEENLLNLPLDRYDDESIAVHEFCHTIDAALSRIDPTWRKRLGETYRSAVGKGLWKNAYTGSNQAEYWAEICQSYFDCNRINNWNHASIGTREQLKQYDPEGYDLVRTTFKLTPANDWRYQPLRRQPSVIPPPAKFKMDPHYTKFSSAREFTVLGSKQVSDAALLKANDTIRKMFAYRHDILKAMIADGARLVVLGAKEKLSHLPEFKDSKDAAGFDEVRYLDYTPGLKLMVVPEENVLCLPNDPFAGKCMVISVFAKALHQVTGLRPADPHFDKQRGAQQYELRVKRLDIEFDQRLRKIYEEAMSKNRWKGTPAAHNRVEYWTSGVEAYFDAAGDGQPPNLSDRPITTRAALQVYDPDLYALVDETMAYKEHVDWRYRPHVALDWPAVRE
jgi:dipeptidyl aminopeptidase/acylaminoacyl peptidase